MHLRCFDLACYHPLRAYKTSSLTENGKPVIKFMSKFSSMVDQRRFDNLSSDEKLLLPCGQCIGCRLDYSRQWALRCFLECLDFENNWFVTLTYDDDHLPSNINGLPDDNGELSEVFISHPLVKHDVSSFLKDLRAYFDYHFSHNNIRFFACGEYGDRNFRPHYHVIFFNLPLADLHVCKESSKNGFQQFESPLLSSIWKRGLVRVSEVNFQTCSYVARYMTKKHKGLDSDFYEINGITPEFSLMSRRPGIGRSYYDRNKNTIYKTDNLVYRASEYSSVVSKPPRYFDKLFDVEQPDLMSSLKQQRKATAENNVSNMLLNTSKSYFEVLLDNEELSSLKCKSLLREL